MTNRPLDAYSEVVDTKRRWTVEWYTWLTRLAASVDAGSGVGAPVFGASGPSHSKGDVPDPGATAGITRFLREDATWVPTLVLPKQLAGLTLANDSTTSATVLDIDAGSACSDDNVTMMVLSAAITKNCNAAWTAGSGGGALEGPLISHLAASTWYHVFLIGRIDTNTPDIFISTGLSPILPLPYTKKRRIGSIRTDASAHIIKFAQVGDQFLWAASTNGTVSGTWDVFNSGVNAGPTGTGFTLFTPPGISTKALLWVATTTAIDFVIFSSLQNVSVIGGWNLGNASVANTQGFQYEIWTNTGSQIFVIAATAQASGFFLSTAGWTDPRGK